MGNRVLVIEDNDLVRESFVRTLRDLGYEANGVGTLKEAKELVNRKVWSRHPIDIMLVDLKLPDGIAIPLIEVAVELDPCPVVVAITAFLDDAYALTFTRLGALYVPKPIVDDNLAELMKLVEQRRSDFPALYGRERGLTAREIQALRHALKGRTYEQTAEAMGVSLATIKTVWQRIFKRTGVSSQSQIISEVIDHWTRESALLHGRRRKKPTRRRKSGSGKNGSGRNNNHSKG